MTMKNTVNKLYSFIARLITLLEDELDDLGNNRSKNALSIKKSLTETLNKLVIVITQLNKLSKEDSDDKYEMISEDKNIIKRFIEKYNSQN